MAVALSLPSPPASAHRRRPSPGRHPPRLPRAALIESRPVSASETDVGGGRGQYAIQLAAEMQTPAAVSPRPPAPLSVIPKDRAEDMQAEARAMARAANATVYDPQLLAAKYAAQPLKVLSRTLEIFTALGTFALKLVADQRRGQLDQRKRQRAAELTKTFTRLGPTFVKIGQGLSTRPDICPPEYLDELSELQDALPTFPNEEAFACIERELGTPLESIYSSISVDPIAAASLGQVYKAQLKYSGQVVAVKVQRPAIEEAIGLDFYLLRGLGFLINKYVDIITSDVVALIDEFAKRVYQELNYVQEGQNARRFKKFYADKEYVIVPDIYWDYTSTKVLTMDWVNGVKLSEQETIEKQGLKLLDLVNIGVQCSLRQLLEYGFFHADPHPALRNFFDDALNSTVSELNFKTIVDGLGNVLYQYPFNVPAYYALILRSLTVLEGLALYADPNFKVLAASYPYFAKRLLTDPNPYLRDALIELLFKDGRFRWNRLENLLVQGRKDRDFTTKDALQPVLKLLLGPDGEQLRVLVVKEAVRVTEAIVLGTMIDAYDSMPEFMKGLVTNGNASGPFKLSDGEQTPMLELRDTVFRIWGLLRSSDNFDPSLLQPILQVLEEPTARNLGGRVFGGITQRLAARLLQQVLRSASTAAVPQ
ncbi:hypothetical protein OPV22_013284 [Ensete ventricosum]|uniref:ABC1 atypical kinase-like domain-containing protein n=1 Tax=Ensete ventricosum TaxID=4639 RepID=A0AAV8R754_ENSVE|nr:hypothetical protein OPV22_013284 [Ensete ventricosum]